MNSKEGIIGIARQYHDNGVFYSSDPKAVCKAMTEALLIAVEALEKDVSRLSTLANNTGKDVVSLWAQESHEALSRIRSL